MMTAIDDVLRSQLTPEQYAAATDGTREVLTIACAGSGKSRTLAFRIARLVAEGVDARAIVAFTFTKKAAESIKRRVAESLAAAGHDPTLLGAMYIQLVTAVEAGVEHRACMVCDKWMTVRSERRRADSALCSKRCRAKATRERRKAARELHRAGRTPKQIADEVGFPVKRVRSWLGLA